MEIRKQMEDSYEEMKEFDRKMRKLQDLFTTQWGNLVERLAEKDLATLLNKRGIKVRYTFRKMDSKRKDINFEFDIIAVNDAEIVIVEVRTTLRSEDVLDFLKKLDKAKEWMPEYKNHQIIGAVACLEEQSESLKMAMKNGLLAIKATGSSASIVNKPDFKPRIW